MPVLRKEYKDVVFIAEWCVIQDSVGKCGFDLDFGTHDNICFNELYRNEPKTNLDIFYERGKNYFSADGEGSLDLFVKYIEFLYSKIDGKGSFTLPTGTHDEIRMSTFKSLDLIKTIFAFLLTIRQVPMIYYGDEIGMTQYFDIDKDGGWLRTGARTPMQWNNQKNRGFSTAKKLYLPVKEDTGISVESQEKDESSILNTVRKLIKIRKENPALSLNGKQEFLCKNYPCVIRRFDDSSEIIVAINPSDKFYELEYFDYEELFVQNVHKLNQKYQLKNQSILILKKKKSL